MSSTVFLPPKGGIYKIISASVNPGWQLNPSPTMSGAVSYLVITDVSVNGEDFINQQISLGDHKILTVTGKNFGKISVTFNLLLGSIEANGGGLGNVISFVESNRVSSTGSVLQLSHSSGVVFEWVLNGFEINSNRQLTPEFNIMTVTLAGSLISH